MITDSKNETYEGELSLGLVVKTSLKYVRYLWVKKWWIVVIGLITGTLFFLRAYLKEPIYTAQLSFMIAEENNDRGGGLAAALGQFGGFGAFGGGSEYNLERITALGKSRKIVENALMDTVSTANWKGLFANLMIDSLNLHDKWGEDPQLRGYYFDGNRKDTFLYHRALKIVQAKLVGNNAGPGIVSLSYQPETSILVCSANSHSEWLSLLASRTVYKHLSQYYVENSIGQRKVTVNNLRKRLDSIKTELEQVEVQLATSVDRLNQVIRSRDRLKAERLGRDKQILTILYGETLKNYEASYFVLRSETPVFQVLDRPVRPLDMEVYSPFRKLIIGGFLGGVLAILGLVSVKTIKDSIAV